MLSPLFPACKIRWAPVKCLQSHRNKEIWPMQIGAYYQVAFHMIQAILIKQNAKPLETTDYILFLHSKIGDCLCSKLYLALEWVLYFCNSWCLLIQGTYDTTWALGHAAAFSDDCDLPSSQDIHRLVGLQVGTRLGNPTFTPSPPSISEQVSSLPLRSRPVRQDWWAAHSQGSGLLIHIPVLLPMTVG